MNTPSTPIMPPSTGVRLCPLTEGSHILAAAPGADFADCYCFADPLPQASALESYLALTAHTPNWMNALMALRNQAVRWVGLKHLGALNAFGAGKPAAAYQIGERIGIFSLLHLQPQEVVLTDNDKHLCVQVSLFKHTVQGQAAVSLGTVVHIHNRLGHMYMSVVGPVHSLIVPLMLKQVLKQVTPNPGNSGGAN